MVPDGLSGELTILLLTYGRLEYAKKTLKYTLDNLHTTVPVNVHIASDGDSDDYINELRHFAGGYAHVNAIYQTNSQRGGYGKNYNLATQMIHNNGTRWVLVVEDDWELTRVFNIDPLLYVLDECVEIGCIRLGYMSYTQELKGTILDHQNRKYLVFDPDSAEPHVFAGHPRVESVAWQKQVGVWPEGLMPGATEFYVATEMRKSRERVAWPLDVVRPCGDLFAHFGTLRAY